MDAMYSMGMGHRLVDPRPYLVPGYAEWLRRMTMNAHVVVLAEYPGVAGIPPGFTKKKQMQALIAEDDKLEKFHHFNTEVETIVLNMGVEACRSFSVDPVNGISLQVRFGGKPMLVTIPMKAILAMYDATGQETNMTEIVGCKGAIIRHDFLTVLTPDIVAAMKLDPRAPQQKQDPVEVVPTASNRPSFLKRVK